ncbi:hypothetical protein Mal4_33100 [Maioricimonas rarisocia]|uniref:Uncharacterized protein n=1 Tax=Maioricimonas rarisocia TaxID=2528026 RepID=A0A517Z921_9PLAN|nr:hypothetical protein [Maioricimonas rarisocia]QDU38978.1 hypothetical protein Mal4_33100 [Maioricimonas rarisocia]
MENWPGKAAITQTGLCAVVDASESNHRAIEVGMIVVSGRERRTVIRMHGCNGLTKVDLAARVDERYDVRTVSLRDLFQRLRSGDRIESAPPSLLPVVAGDGEVPRSARRLLIEAAVQAIGSAFFVNGCLACEVLDVCRHSGEHGSELRVVVACQQLDLDEDPLAFLNGASGPAATDQIESIDVEHWMRLMVATDWTTLPMAPGCGAPLSEQETERYLAELLDGGEMADDDAGE